MSVNPQWIGYYDSAEQSAPTYDPGDAAPCAICEEPWTEDTVRTISICATEGARSLFYRTHRTCRDNQSEEEQDRMDGEVADMSVRWLIGVGAEL